MPRHWSDFIRNAPIDTVRPLGTTAAAAPASPPRFAPAWQQSGSLRQGSANAFWWGAPGRQLDPDQQQQQPQEPGGSPPPQPSP